MKHILSIGLGFLSISGFSTAIAQGDVPSEPPMEMVSENLPEDLAFALIRKGRQIGTHYIRFSQEGETLVATIDINIEVKFGPITVYSYEHRNQERWKDGQLTAIETKTDANGKDFNVSGSQTAEGFSVTGYEGALILPLGIIPTSYWNMDILEQTTILDTQKGIARSVTVTKGNAEGCGDHYVVRGELDLDLWYDDGNLCGLTFENAGTLISYEPLAS